MGDCYYMSSQLFSTCLQLPVVRWHFLQDSETYNSKFAKNIEEIFAWYYRHNHGRLNCVVEKFKPTKDVTMFVVPSK